MSRVSLEALAPAVVPEFECVVECRRQNVFAVWRELHERNRRIIVVYQSL